MEFVLTPNKSKKHFEAFLVFCKKNIVMLLFWFYILGYIFVIGLYLNKRRSDAGIELENTMV